MERTIQSYIRKELARGIPSKRIKEALILVGHDIPLVEKTIKEEEELLRQSMGIDAQLDSDLLGYINYSIEHGKTLEQVKNELLKAGHHPLKVHKHITHVESKKNASHNPKANLMNWIIVSFLLFLILAFTIFYMVENAYYKKPMGSTVKQSSINKSAAETSVKTPTCGNGFCENDEVIGKNCPQDCGAL